MRSRFGILWISALLLVHVVVPARSDAQAGPAAPAETACPMVAAI